MPRGKQSVADQIAALAAKTGLTITADMQATLDAAVPRNPEELEFSLTEDIRIRSAAAIDFLQHPHQYVTKKCTHCKELFATNYSYVGTCSTSCAIRRMQVLTGIHWEWTLKWYNKSLEERWNRHQAPAVIDPDLLKSLVHIADMYRTAQEQTDQTQPQLERELLHQEDESPESPGIQIHHAVEESVYEVKSPSHQDESSPAPGPLDAYTDESLKEESVFDF